MCNWQLANREFIFNVSALNLALILAEFDAFYLFSLHVIYTLFYLLSYSFMHLTRFTALPKQKKNNTHNRPIQQQLQQQ